MNSSIIRYILGHVLKIEALVLLLPCFVALIYKEEAGISFFITFLINLFSHILYLNYSSPPSFLLSLLLHTSPVPQTHPASSKTTKTAV